MKRLLFLFVLGLTSLALAQNSCFDCHGYQDFTTTTDAGEEIALYVSDSTYQASVHGGFDCIDCHTDAVGDPHPEKLKKVSCSVCHDDQMVLYEQGVHGKSHLAGNLEAPDCADCHGKHNILNSSDPLATTYVVNLPKTCGQCHNGAGVGEKHDLVIAQPSERFERGVHYKALLDGNTAAASCNSCHESHRLLPMSDPDSPINSANLSKTCGQCHGLESEEFDASSHGVALVKGVREAPTCNSCHGEHEILSPSDPSAYTSGANISDETCSPCHGIAKLNEKYGLLPDPVESYRNSYHGLASVAGSKVAANCVSCHGAHDVLSSSDPNSSIHPANLQETCGQCHINVTENFTKSYVHSSPTSSADRYARIIKQIYILLIIVVIGGMVLHNFVIYFSYVRAKYRLLKMHETITRFDKQWVVQHMLIFISFTVLVITGFALKFANSEWAFYLAKLGFTETLRGLLHRIAAVVMLTTGAYHIIYLLFFKSAKGEIMSLLPNINDLRQFFQNMKYYLGISKQKPDFARYGYVEKAEYWALVWGTVIMALTGFVLWFPTSFTTIFPAWIIKVSETIHYYEAWLATLAILLYHMFFAIFHPADYPINLTSLTGKMTLEEAEERFPAWVRSVKKKDQD
ncbi:cytochrome c3 family protein [candidate division KSB1 bacterium]|nr:cytochrome c3 family protein [candidate division KSB1 bacterium]